MEKGLLVKRFINNSKNYPRYENIMIIIRNTCDKRKKYVCNYRNRFRNFIVIVYLFFIYLSRCSNHLQPLNSQ